MKQKTTIATIATALVVGASAWLWQQQPITSPHPVRQRLAPVSAEQQFIIGPQVDSGTHGWYDDNAIERGHQFGQAFAPAPPLRSLTGSLAVVKGSKSVVGNGTHFTLDLPPPVNQFNFIIRDSAGATQTYYIASVTDDTHLVLSQPWQGTDSTNLSYQTITGDELDTFLNANYYDQAYVQYINYHRTGDVMFQAYARKIADSWWKVPLIDEGRASVENILAPRTASLNGLMLRALDGRPEMWPWLTTYTRRMFDIWVSERLSYTGLYYGPRESGYMLLYAANLAAVHPDSATRDEFRAKALGAASSYFIRLQKPDGSWRWGDGAWIGDAMQPFHVGILLEGLIAVHRLTGDPTVRAAIIKGVEGTYLGYNPNQWRAMYYQKWGSWSDGTDCTGGCGAASTPYPGTYFGQVAEARQLNATCLHAFGYAYLLTGDVKFKQWGDDIFDASFNTEQGFRLLAWYRPKEYDEAYRSSGRYLAWVSSAPQPQPSVSPTVSPTPTVSITPTPSTTPTPIPSPTPTPTIATPSPTPTLPPTPIPTPTPKPCKKQWWQIWKKC